MISAFDGYVLTSRIVDGLFLPFSLLLPLAAIYYSDKEKDIADRIGIEIHHSMNYDPEKNICERILTLKQEVES